MSVNAVSATQADQSLLRTQKAEPAVPKTAAGRDLKNYHGGDDAVAPTAGPSVTLSGQAVGTTLSERA